MALTKWVLIDFFALQSFIYGSRLLLLRQVKAITSNREEESPKQDLRLWSTEDQQEYVTMTFYTNSRVRRAKLYFRTNCKYLSLSPLRSRLSPDGFNHASVDRARDLWAAMPPRTRPRFHPFLLGGITDHITDRTRAFEHEPVSQ